jgi:glutaredoxin
MEYEYRWFPMMETPNGWEKSPVNSDNKSYYPNHSRLSMSSFILWRRPAQIVIYTTTAFHCPYCIKAKKALEEFGLVYAEKDISNSKIKAELLKMKPDSRTIPQIFYQDGNYLGDCDELINLIKNGSLSSCLDIFTTNEFHLTVASLKREINGQ